MPPPQDIPDTYKQGPTITSQMLTLGLDAGDDRSTKRSVEMVDSNSEAERSTWWNRAFHSADGGFDSRVAASSPEEIDRPQLTIDEVDTDYLYSQMDDHVSLPGNAGERIESSKPQRTIQEGFRKVGGALNKLQKSLIRYPQSQRSRSDRSHMILRDGHFYYRDMESQVSSLNSSNQMTQHRSGSLSTRSEVESHCNYFQAPSTVVDPELKRYREKFDDLNKDVKYLKRDRLLECDLHLSSNEDLDENDTHEGTRNSILRTAQTSSLFYEVEEGGMTLLCLPRDHVRLAMDPELQTGTLAVEQWRRADESGQEISWPQRRSCSFCPGCKKEFTFGRDFSIHPDLRYTLVVNDDLYRNLISELSSHCTEPYCGVNRWCLEDEKVDIRVAIGFLLIVFSLMFATTIVLPTQ